MSLPHEPEVAMAIATKYRVQLDAMTGLHDAVVGMMKADYWTIGNRRGLDRIVAFTVVGLLTKAIKTFRSIQILCERGVHKDADVLVRVLMETTVAVMFKLQKKSRERSRIYQAHTIVQDIKMLNEWKNTSGLKRKARVQLINDANNELARWTKALPAGTDVKRHWSGRGSLQEAVKSLRGDAMYATLYRYTSSISHASDFGAHFSVEEPSGSPLWEIEPQMQGFEVPSYAARQLLWSLANRIDHRLALGFSATLAPQKLSRADVQGGQK